MNFVEKALSLEGRKRYEFYVKLLHKSKRFHINYTDYIPVDFQYDDWLFMDETPELCLVRSCGGSKTFDTSLWVVLRVMLNPDEKWAWCAAASGQLLQARIFFSDNPFVKSISGGRGEEFINLVNGSRILFRGTTKSITGIRLDGIILDEEEMLEPNQVEVVYPQLHGRMTHSKVGKFFHLGTMEEGTQFMENIENYPSRIHDWLQCPWLVKAGQIQKHIDDGIMPKFEIDMLYRCIPSVAGGKFFANIKVIPPFEYDPIEVDYGVDFGGTDHVVGTIVRGKRCIIVEEYEVDLERDHSALDFLDGAYVGAEGGGYNDAVKYSAKARLLTDRISATRIIPTNKYKTKRKMRARGFEVIEVVKVNCEKTLKDMKSCKFGPDGLWLKNKKTPCHWVDGYMLSLKPKKAIWS